MTRNYHKGFRSTYKLTAQVVLVTKYRQKAINEKVLQRLKEIFGVRSQESGVNTAKDLKNSCGDKDREEGEAFGCRFLIFGRR